VNLLALVDLDFRLYPVSQTNQVIPDFQQVQAIQRLPDLLEPH